MIHIKALSLVLLMLCSLTLPLISAEDGEDAIHTHQESTCEYP